MFAPYVFQSATRIRFGRGVAAEAAVAIGGLGARVLVVHGRDRDRAGWLLQALAAAGLAVEGMPCAGEPDLDALEASLAIARAFAPDVVVGLGGGAAMDMAKALAALTGAPGGPMDHLEVVGRGLPLSHALLPFVAIPTTAGTGSEVTRNAVIGVPARGVKVSLRDDRMLARVALVDPALTDGTPAHVTLASGLDAVVQVIEPYVSARANPMTDALCLAAIPMGLQALARLCADPGDRAARDAMAQVSLWGGLALGNAGLGAVHGLAGVLGGRTGAAHGALCGALLGPVLVANRQAAASGSVAAERLGHVERLLREGWGVGPEGVADWTTQHGLPRLRDMGVSAADLPPIIAGAQASSSMKGNPVALTDGALTALMQAALA